MEVQAKPEPLVVLDAAWMRGAGFVNISGLNSHQSEVCEAGCAAHISANYRRRPTPGNVSMFMQFFPFLDAVVQAGIRFRVFRTFTFACVDNCYFFFG